jgi:hypothetical protein
VLARLEVEGWPRDAGTGDMGSRVDTGGVEPAAGGRRVEGGAGSGGAAHGASGDHGRPAPNGPDGRVTDDARGYPKLLITQNIDNLRNRAGKRSNVELRSNSHALLWLSCGE